MLGKYNIENNGIEIDEEIKNAKIWWRIENLFKNTGRIYLQSGWRKGRRKKGCKNGYLKRMRKLTQDWRKEKP